MLRHLAFLGFALTLAGLRAAAQSLPAPAAKRPAPARAVAQARAAPHHFFDRANLALFAGVAAVRVLDFTSTEHFRERGHNEVLLTNSIVDNKPLFAVIEAAGFAASVAVSYWLYRRGHYRLERWVSILHIGVAAAGDIHNYALGRPGGPGTP